MRKSLVLFFALCVPAVAWAQGDAQKIESARAAIDSVVTNRPYLRETLGIRVMKSNQHPEWVQVDFPLTSMSGAEKRRVEAAMRDLFVVGGEPAFRDSVVVSGGYVRTYVPGRVHVHRDAALTTLIRMASGVNIGDTTGAATRDTCDDGGWRLYLKKFWPGRF